MKAKKNIKAVPALTPATDALRPALSDEEVQVIAMYRQISRWEKNALFLLIKSLAWGTLTEKTDEFSWGKMRRTMLELPRRAQS